jgi:hypothetical protein
MQTVLTSVADAAARATRFVQRTSKLTGALFVQTLVFGFLADRHATRESLAQTAAALGVDISPQGLDQRLTEEAAHCLEQVLEAAAATVLLADPVAIPLLSRFNGVYMQDTTIVGLPRTLAHIWRGLSNQHTKDTPTSALKLGVRLDLAAGALVGPTLDHGCCSDRRSQIQYEPIPKGALRMADLGFFDLKVLAEIGQDDGFWLNRLQISTAVFQPDGSRVELLTLLEDACSAVVDQPVLLGVQQQLPARRKAVKVAQEVADQRRRRIRAEAKRRGRAPSELALALAAWTILITNLPPELLSVEEALVLARARWQIELLFKLWKSQGQIDHWRSGKPWAILCELYAKVIAMIIQHWLFLVSCWAYPDRSLSKAVTTIKKHAMCLATSLGDADQLAEAIAIIARCLAGGCRINKRKTTPHTYQLLLDLTEATLG